MVGHPGRCGVLDPGACSTRRRPPSEASDRFTAKNVRASSRSYPVNARHGQEATCNSAVLLCHGKNPEVRLSPPAG